MLELILAAGVDWPMGLYDELPKLTSKDGELTLTECRGPNHLIPVAVHIGRLPTDNSEKLVDIQRTMVSISVHDLCRIHQVSGS